MSNSRQILLSREQRRGILCGTLEWMRVPFWRQPAFDLDLATQHLDSSAMSKWVAHAALPLDPRTMALRCFR